MVANHVRWCKNNPQYIEYRESYLDSLKKARENKTAESYKKHGESIRKRWKEGIYDHVDHRSFLGRKHTEESKNKIRIKALKSSHRRLVRSIRSYTCKDGTIISLDSAWEEALAIRLDELSITWTRPSPLKWVDKEGITHNYFPDFFLPDYNIFLDPKNPIAYKVQQAKIECLLIQYPNIKFLRTLDECKQFTFDALS